MARKLLTLIFMLAFTLTTFATQRGERGSAGQHSHQQSRHEPSPHEPSHHEPSHREPSHHEPNRNHGRNDNHGRDGRHFSRDEHRHVRAEERRYRGGRTEIFFGGYWFACESWPAWVFEEEVYVEMVGPDIYVMYVYNNPAARVYIIVVE